MSIAKNAILRAKLNDQLVELLVKTNAAQVIIDEKGTTLASHLTTLATSKSVEDLQALVNALTGEGEGAITKLGALAGKSEVGINELSTELAALINGKVDQSTYNEFVEGANMAMGVVSTRLEELVGEDGTGGAIKGIKDRLDAIDGEEGRLATVEGTVATHGQLIEGAGQILNTLMNVGGENGEPIDTNKSIRQIANEELVKQLIIDDAEDKLDTLQQIADWIQNHPDDASAMNSAIQALKEKTELGTYADGEETKEYATVKAYVEAYVAGIVTSLSLGDMATKNTVNMADFDEETTGVFNTMSGVISTLAGDDAGKSARAIAGEVLTAANLDQYAKTADLGDLAAKDIITEDFVDPDLMAKINASSDGNHSHDNKKLLDTYTQTEADLAAAVAQKHTHANAEVLNAITSDRVNAWDAKSDSKIFYTTTDAVPEGMGNDDLWFLIIED